MKKTKILELTGVALGLGSMLLGLLGDKVDDEQRKEEIKEEVARQIINAENDIDEDKES
jgi:hypothetical protein